MLLSCYSYMVTEVMDTDLQFVRPPHSIPQTLSLADEWGVGVLLLH